MRYLCTLAAVAVVLAAGNPVAKLDGGHIRSVTVAPNLEIRPFSLTGDISVHIVVVSRQDLPYGEPVDVARATVHAGAVERVGGTANVR